MKNRIEWLAVGAALSFFGAQWVAAAEPQAPKPSAEHQRLGYFVGTWNTVGEMKASEMGPGGKISSTDKCTWYDGGFAVVCNSDGKTPAGPNKSLGILGYSAEEKVYTYMAIDNTGMAMTTIPHGKLQGDTWIYDDESVMGGKKVKSRVTIKELSPSEYTFKMEMQAPDGKWMSVMESKSTKTK